MCDKTLRKIKKGSKVSKIREARRQMRLIRTLSPPPNNDAQPMASSLKDAPKESNEAHQAILYDLALRTASLMQKNQEIQEQIAALKRETSKFLARVMSDPDNRRRCLRNIQLSGVINKQEYMTQEIDLENVKMEPET